MGFAEERPARPTAWIYQGGRAGGRLIIQFLDSALVAVIKPAANAASPKFLKAVIQSAASVASLNGIWMP